MLVLAAIAVGSVIVFARTNRQFNIGLVVAAGAVCWSSAWIVVATRFAAATSSRAGPRAPRGSGSSRRPASSPSRPGPTRPSQLIARGDITASEKSFNDHIDQLGALLGTAPSAAADAVDRWSASHRKQVEAYNGGDYPAAVDAGDRTGPNASAAQFAVVESSLRDEIEHTRATLRDGVSAAGTWLAWSPTGALVLMVVAAAAAVVGLWPRLKEFL